MHPADRRSKKKDKSPNAKADEGFYLFFLERCVWIDARGKTF